MKELKEAILLSGNSENCADLLYATGFDAPDAVVYLDTGMVEYLLVPRLELNRARRAVKERHKQPVCRVLSTSDFSIRKNARNRYASTVRQLLRVAGVTAVRVPETFPVGIARRLEKSGIRVNVADGDLFSQRAVKRPWELRRIRESQQAAVIAMRAAVAMIATSEIDAGGYLRLDGSRLTSERLREAVGGVLLKHGCFCRDVIAAGGKQSADPHARGGGPFRAGEPIVIDIFPRHLDHGYWGDITRTVVKGPAARRVKRMYRAVRAAQNAALATIRPGVKGATVHAAAEREIERRGFGKDVSNGKTEGFIHGTGHGVGLCIHEAPALARVQGRLRSGHVVTVEPGLYYSDVGGVRVEDTVVVTPGGWQYLVPCEKRLEV